MGAGADFVVHMLDVNRDKYGDCIVVLLGSQRILIDGGHPGDQARKLLPAALSIPEQLGEIFGEPPPYRFDLLVVTHCHQDHIGCLPALVKADTISAEWVLVADERFGWPGPFSKDSGLDSRFAAALAGWREEGLIRGDDVTVAALLADAVKLEDRYAQMLETLKDRGAKVLRFGRDDLAELEQRFKPEGLHVIGPSSEHLAICSRAIDESGQTIARDALLAADDSRDAVAIYRQLSYREDGIDATGGSRPGAALNNQSIVIFLHRNGRKVLLTGDMQLAEPEVAGLDSEMRELRRTLAELGPFDLVKLPHHGARNGFSEEVLTELGARLWIVSTGEGSSRHPHARTLEILGNQMDGANWFRTDRNGRVAVDFSGESPRVGVERGEVNDATPAFEADLTEGSLTEPLTPAAPPSPSVSVQERIQVTRDDQDPAWVEVSARIPRMRTRVTLTIEIEPLEEEKKTEEPLRAERPFRPGPHPEIQDVGPIEVKLAPDLPRLLFVTDVLALEKKIGRFATKRALKAITEAGQVYIDRPFSKMPPSRAAGITMPIAVDRQVKGVVLLGGYGVVPPEPADVLKGIYGEGTERTDDPDQFWVWSDDHFGRVGTADGLPDLPVSRVPDGGSAALLLRSLGAARRGPLSAWAIRNARRPFAEEIYRGLPGARPMIVSAPALAQSLPGISEMDLLYFVLHGSSSDGTSLSGEELHQPGRLVEAFGLGNVRGCPGAVVFSGSCWGALIVDAQVHEDLPLGDLPPRLAKTSIALRFLEQGANAFIGCTGAHYSPVRPPFGYGSAPLHTAFFRHLCEEKLAPAAALLAAKRDYVAGSPYQVPEHDSGPGAPVVAIERKTLLQYSCLGLGW